jgi:hypothetical protein
VSARTAFVGLLACGGMLTALGQAHAQGMTHRLGPQVRSIGPLVNSPTAVVPRTVRSPAPPPAPGGSCGAGAASQTWNLGGMVNALEPGVIQVEGLNAISTTAGAVSSVDPKAVALLNQLPAMMVGDLALRLSQLQPALASKVVDAITAAPVLHRDEMAFLVAHLPLEDLTSDNFNVYWLTETAAHIYEAASSKGLGYVKMVEKTDPANGAGYTTLSYRIKTKTGDIVESEIPPDVYYWYVVQPKLDQEPLALTDPTTGEAASRPTGLTSREYFLFTPSDAPPYTRHFVFDNPNYLTSADLQNWGPSAATVFAGLTMGTLEHVKTPKGLAMIEFHTHPGTLLATTMPLEKAAQAGKPKLLENALMYGDGNTPDRPQKLHLVLMDRAPYGSDAFANTLATLKTQKNYNYEIKTHQEFLAPLALDGYSKLIVPSDQPKDLYLALETRRADIETWMATRKENEKGNVFELHAATSQADDWSGHLMPYGFTIAPLDGTSASESVEMGGYPDLSSFIKGADILWDSQMYPAMSGDRLFDPNSFALDRFGLFTSRNLPDNVAEWTKKNGMAERAEQAVRVLYNHFGNCGELQDMLSAAARSGLVPVMNVGSSLTDHAWNQFYSPLDHDWLPYQVSWNGAQTHVAYPGISYEKKWGADKDIPVAQGNRPDGFYTNETHRYSDTWKLDLTVVDQAKHPIDGATVLLFSEAPYPDSSGNYGLGFGWYGFTGPDGKLVANFGDARNFYVQVHTPIGSNPPQADKVGQLAQVAETTAGSSKTVKATIAAKPTILPAPTLPDMLPTVASGTSYLQLTLSSRGLYLAAKSDPTYGVPPESFNQMMGEGPVDAYLLDETNYAAWKGGQPSTALWGVESVGNQPVTLCGPAPAQGKAYLVFAAPDHLVIGPSINAELSVHSLPGVPDAGVDSSKPDTGTPGAEPSLEAGPPGDETPGTAIEPSGSCGCRTSSSNNGAGAALFALGCLMLRARRRRPQA